MTEQTDEFIFDPSLIETSDAENKQEENVEELNLLKDPIFDENAEIKKEPNEVLDEDNKETEIDTPDPDNIKEKDDPSSKAVFSVVLGQDLMDRGIISSFDSEGIQKISQEQGEAAAVTAIMEAQAKATSDELKSSYDANYQDYLNLTQGGVSQENATGLQQLENFQSSLEGLDLTTEDDESVAARKDLLAVNYRLNTNFSEDKIQKLVQKAYEEGSDLEEIDDAIAGLKNYTANERNNVINQAKQQQEQQFQQQAQLEHNYKDYINKTEEYFKGEKITQKTKNDIESILFNPVKSINGQTTNQLWAKRDLNPIEFDSKIAYLDSIGYFDNKPLDKFVKNATTKQATKLEGFLNDNKGRNFMKSSGKSFNNSAANKADFLDF